MKNLKNYLKLFLVINLLYLASCTDNDNGGTPGGATTDDRDDFVGLWSVTENSTVFGNSVYDSEIQKNTSSSSNIAIDNFYQLGLQVITQAIVSGNTLSIPQQTITQKTIQGSGELIDKKTIEFNFTVDDGAAIDTVYCIYNKK